MLTRVEGDLSRIGVAREVTGDFFASRDADVPLSDVACALLSQQRRAAAQLDGLFGAETAPREVIQKVTDRDSGELSCRKVRACRDEGNRPGITLGDLARLSPAFRGGQQLSEGRSVTAGNASQLSDGASAAVIMEEAEVTRRRLTPLGRHVGTAVAGCDPDEMGIGPVHAVPKLLAAHGGVQRGVRQPSPGQCAGAGSADGSDERQWRRDFGRTPLWHVGRPHGRPRADRGARAMSSAPCASVAAWGLPDCSRCSDPKSLARCQISGCGPDRSPRQGPFGQDGPAGRSCPIFPERRAAKRASGGPKIRTIRKRSVCSAMTRGRSTLLDAAMIATESMPPGLVAR